jgi:cobalt/nickel transport system permease protein
MLGNLLTYVTASVQLGLAFPAAEGGMTASILKFMSIFAVTQVPLAVSEGVLTVLIINILSVYSQKELQLLSAFTNGKITAVNQEAKA